MLPAGTPDVRARARDSAVAGLLDVAEGTKVELIGVVNPLVDAITVRGGTVALTSVAAVYFSPTPPFNLLLTALMGAGHATVAAWVTTLLVRRSGDLRGSALSMNAAGMSLGTFLGAALGGLGLALGGYPGTALTFASITLIAVLFALRVRRRGVYSSVLWRTCPTARIRTRTCARPTPIVTGSSTYCGTR